MAPSKHPKLGQHFLQDVGYRQRILAELPVRADELVIEIGPGRGAMTGLLAGRARKVVAIEIDPALAARLESEFASEPRVAIVTQDILAVDIAALLKQHDTSECFVFGNLPYYITSPILHHLFRFRALIRGMGLLMQREVAERVTAKPGSRDYGYLTIATQVHSEPRIALAVPPGAFSPPPKVHSALVTFTLRPQWPEWTEARTGEFLEFAKRCFAQKRKNLLNNLAGLYSRARVEAALATIGQPATVRAEQLSLEHLAAVFQNLNKLT